MQRGIREALRDGAAVIWCHNTFGFEDIPNWMAGLLDAQNIFDGGSRGSYKDTFYRYLNLGMDIPFSTGTDWFIYDFSRVYVPISGKLTSRKWLRAVADGRSFITNGPFLELRAGEHGIGDHVELSRPGQLRIAGRGVGRLDFRKIELVVNGEIVHSAASQRKEGHYTAGMEYTLNVREPAWAALRIPLDAGVNELDKPLFAHTSPIYVHLAGKRVFRPQIARDLIEEMKQSMEVIREKAVFADGEEREAVLRVYRDGIKFLDRRISAEASP
jgi:hypothetical protein